MLGKSQLKYIQSLGHKKQRDEEQLFIAEGPRIVRDLMETIPAHIRNVYHLHGSKDFQPLPGIEATEISEEELARISQLKAPNQVLAVVRQFNHPLPSVAAGGLILALDSIRDPGNLGTMIRIADWFGLKEIVCSEDCADVYNPKVVQATMGSIGRIAVTYTDLEQWLLVNKGRGSFMAAALDGENVKDAGATGGVLIIGNEARGISDPVFALVDRRITIPGKGGAESLNAAVAAGILLSHLTT